MGWFNYDIIKQYINDNYKIAVETGTFQGNGTRLLSQYFNTVYTIEIKENLYTKAQQYFANNPKIICLLGNSADIIPLIAYDVNNLQSNVFFWLDAHWSGDTKVDWKKSNWHGFGFPVDTGYIHDEKINNNIPSSRCQVPLEDEIYNIYKNIKNECVIYIDDFDKIDPVTLKGKKNKCFIGEDWSYLDFNYIFEKIKDRLDFKKIENEQCIIKLKKINT